MLLIYTHTHSPQIEDRLKEIHESVIRLYLDFIWLLGLCKFKLVFIFCTVRK